MDLEFDPRQGYQKNPENALMYKRRLRTAGTPSSMWENGILGCSGKWSGYSSSGTLMRSCLVY